MKGIDQPKLLLFFFCVFFLLFFFKKKQKQEKQEGTKNKKRRRKKQNSPWFTGGCKSAVLCDVQSGRNVIFQQPCSTPEELLKKTNKGPNSTPHNMRLQQENQWCEVLRPRGSTNDHPPNSKDTFQRRPQPPDCGWTKSISHHRS